MSEQLDEFEKWFFSALNEVLEKKGTSLDDLSSEDMDAYIKVYDEVMEKEANGLLKALKADMPKMLKEKRKDDKTFTSEIYTNWGRALDLLKALIALCQEISKGFTKKHYRETGKNLNLKTTVLIQLQSRACLISEESLCLLKNGFADGANARWRSLYEIFVVARLIFEDDGDLAERYFYHRAIQSWIAMNRYKEHHPAMSVEMKSEEKSAFTERHYREIERTKDRLCKLYGADYRHEYGWASEKLKIAKPTFTHLEKEARTEFMKPFYRAASRGVHAFSPGFISLGNPIEQDFIIRGASMLGLSIPGQWIAITLHEITDTLIRSQRTPENVLTLKAIQILVDEICQTFVECDLENDHKLGLIYSRVNPLRFHSMAAAKKYFMQRMYGTWFRRNNKITK